MGNIVVKDDSNALEAAKRAERFAKQEALLRGEIDALNAVLGLTGAEHRITFGYIGNCNPNGSNDQRRWMVFLPHPGRVGTYKDQVGGFATGDLEGIVATRHALSSVAQGARLARSI